MFALVKATTRSYAAGLIAGVIFAFDPFRFAHYSHLELQWTFCMPLALLFFIRVLERGHSRDGVLLGTLVALQGLSSLYYGAYFPVSLAAFFLSWVCFIAPVGRRGLAALTFATLITAGVALAISRPYLEVRSVVGERGRAETQSYSATSRDYLTVNNRSDLYRAALWDSNDGERKLFPGTLPVVLGAAALLAPGGPFVAPVVVSLVVSIDASLGLNGTIYSWLYDGLPPFRAFRVPGEIQGDCQSLPCLSCGTGCGGRGSSCPTCVAGTRRSVARHAVASGRFARDRDVNATLGSWTRHLQLHIEARRERGRFATSYGSRSVLARSGVHVFFNISLAPSHQRKQRIHTVVVRGTGISEREFPSDTTLDAYQRLGTDYFVLHEGYYGPDTFKRVVSDVSTQPRLAFVATVTWDEGECRLYRLVSQ